MSGNNHRSIDRDSRDHPVVLGAGVMPFNRYCDGSHWRDWVRRAALDAIEDAGIEPKDIGSVVVASETDFCRIAAITGSGSTSKSLKIITRLLCFSIAAS